MYFLELFQTPPMLFVEMVICHFNQNNHVTIVQIIEKHSHQMEPKTNMS
jgi:hypothetical protein